MGGQRDAGMEGGGGQGQEEVRLRGRIWEYARENRGLLIVEVEVFFRGAAGRWSMEWSVQAFPVPGDEHSPVVLTCSITFVTATIFHSVLDLWKRHCHLFLHKG